MSSSNAQDWKPKVREQIEQANDSILEEGIKLYNYEKAAWLGTDLVIEHCKYKDIAFVIYMERGVSYTR